MIVALIPIVMLAILSTGLFIMWKQADKKLKAEENSFFEKLKYDKKDGDKTLDELLGMTRERAKFLDRLAHVIFTTTDDMIEEFDAIKDVIKLHNLTPNEQFAISYSITRNRSREKFKDSMLDMIEGILKDGIGSSDDIDDDGDGLEVKHDPGFKRIKVDMGKLKDKKKKDKTDDTPTDPKDEDSALLD
jgi:hypothetical protein